MDVIYKRRSIRKYTPEPVSREKLEELVKAGMNAPSAANSKPWHFIIIDDKEILLEMVNVHNQAKMLNGAAAAIVVCGEKTLENPKHQGFCALDCAAATENILLEITHQGLGGVWLGIHPHLEPEERLRKILNIPMHVFPFCIIALGYPAEERKPRYRFMPERIRYNKW